MTTEVSQEMQFSKACSLDDLWEGDMLAVEVDGHEILIVHPLGGKVIAYQGICPHQEIPLSEGTLSGDVLMCRAHMWTFDAKTGNGMNPSECKLSQYPLKVVDNDIWVSTDGVVPLHAIG